MSEQDVSDSSKFENNFDNDFNVVKNPDYKIEGNNVFRVNSFTVDKTFKGKGKGKTFTPKGKGKGRQRQRQGEAVPELQPKYQDIQILNTRWLSG